MERLREDRRRLDERLDEALAETFPASDPIAVGHPTGTERPGRPIDRTSLPSQGRARRKRCVSG
jgi:hypothetical protein